MYLQTALPRRPFIKVRYWTWRDHARNATPGVGIFTGNQIQAHLTPAEARNLADKLHDMADQIDAR